MDKPKEDYVEKMVTTTENWYPNYPENKVRVFLRIVQGYNEFVRIAVWGADDFGLEMSFNGTPLENRQKFTEWEDAIFHKVPEPCTKDYFRKLGFHDA